ncbi:MULTISPECIES: TolC family outer membrane protein [Pseudomonas]|uniref:TolC family outer membrane protein n=1 Tax=Pseudomonas TaxID=286 RepID=UPI000B592E18|nr:MULTISPECIES: TolC family outer membrane protein [Pseudomonas]OWQ37221.1 channel protein TolC [Pseudomonas sp. DrBHI1]
MRLRNTLIHTTFLAGLILCTPLLAEPQRAELLQVYQHAVEQDARLSAARHEFQALSERVPQARAGLLPTLNAGATFESTRLQRDEPALTRTRSGMVYQANLNQPLLRLDRWYALKAAEAGTAQAGLDLAAKEQSLILQTAEAYFDTLRALDALAAAKAEAKALKRQQEQAQGRLANGASSITDVLDAQAAYDNASANRQLAQRKVDDAFETLYRLTRQDYAQIAGIAHQLPVQAPVPNDASTWVEQAVQSNLSLLSSGHAVDAAMQANRQRKAGHAPTLDAVASYRKGDNDRFGYSNPTDFGRNGYRDDIAQGTLGLELNIPLYAGGLTSSQVREAGERLAQSEDEHEDRRREVVLQTRNLHRAVNADVEQVQARQQSIRSSQASLKANLVGRALGSRNTADVLNAERQLYRAVREYNDARYDYIIDSLKLKQAAGSLAPQDLLELSHYLSRDYDPDRDFLPPEARRPVAG